MLKQIIEIAAKLFAVTKDVQQVKSGIKELEQEIRDLRQALDDTHQEIRDMGRGFERLAYEIRRVSDTDAAERKMMALQLENTLLKFERRLSQNQPPSGTQDTP